MYAPTVNARSAALLRQERMNAAADWRLSTQAIRTAPVGDRTERTSTRIVAAVAMIARFVGSSLASRRTLPAV